MNEQFIVPSQVGPTGASSMRVPTLSDSRYLWGSVAQISRALKSLRGGNQSALDQFSALKQFGFSILTNPHPFKIYSLPSPLRPMSDPATDWLKYRVRSGMVGDLDVDGTDESDFPDSPDIPLDDLSDEITASSGVAQYFFWIELSDPSSVKTATIKSGEDPNTSGWTDYPDTDGRFILIGWVDTTDTTNKQGKVRQILRTDIQKGVEMGTCANGMDGGVMDFSGYRFDPPPM